MCPGRQAVHREGAGETQEQVNWEGERWQVEQGLEDILGL